MRNLRLVVFAVCGLLLHSAGVNIIYGNIARVDGGSAGSGLSEVDNAARRSQAAKRGAKPFEKARGSPAVPGGNILDEEAGAGVSKGPTSKEGSVSGGNVDAAVQMGLAEAWMKREEAPVDRVIGVSAAENSIVNVPEGPFLMAPSLYDNVTETMSVFASLVTAEDVTLLDATHRPLIEGVTPSERDVEAANAALKTSVSSIQLPEFIPKGISLPSTLEHSTLQKKKFQGNHQYWVPWGYRQAKSWWQVDRHRRRGSTSAEESPGERKASIPDTAARPRHPSSMRLADVTEVFDLSNFGISDLYHPEAHAEHTQCGGFYSTVFFLKKPLGPWGALCSFHKLTEFAEKVGRLFSAHTSSTAEAKGPQLPSPAELAGFHESSQSPESSNEEPSESGPIDILDIQTPSRENLKNELGSRDLTPKLWHSFLTSIADRLSDRRHVASLLLQLKGEIWHKVKASEDLFVPAVAVDVLQSSGVPQPVIMALSSTMLNCRAHLEYRMRGSVGLPSVPSEKRVFHPLIDLFNKNRTTIDIPLEMAVPQKVYVDGRHFKNSPHLRRVNKLYFRSVLMLWHFAYYAYRISELQEDYENVPLDEILFKHWIPSYMAKALFTENGLLRPCVDSAPMHNGEGFLTVRGAVATQSLDMELVRRMANGSSVQYRSKAPPLPRYPFIVDWKTGELVDFKDSFISDYESPEAAPLAKSQQIVYDSRLHQGSPDVCDRDATHHVTMPGALVFRWDRIPEGLTVGEVPEQAEGREGNRSQTLHLDDDVGLGPDDRDHRLPIDDVTSEIPIHRVDTIWSFKGTGQPKQWTFNTMALGVRDPFFSPKAVLHSGLNFLFHQVVRRPMTRFVHEVRLRLKKPRPGNRPYVVAFTGHSQGGASATYAAWFVSKHLREEIKQGLVVVYCISFAAPMIGDNAANEELHRHGAIFHHIIMDIDPVPELKSSRGKMFMQRDTEHTLVIPLHSFARANVFDKKTNKLLYTGLSWLQYSFSTASSLGRLARLASDVTGLRPLLRLRKDMSLFWAHVHTLPCSFTLLAGLLPEAGWSSFCSSPFLQSWPARPYVASLDFDIALNKAWQSGVAKVVARFQRKLAQNPLFLQEAADKIESKYMVAKAAASQD